MREPALREASPSAGSQKLLSRLLKGVDIGNQVGDVGIRHAGDVPASCRLPDAAHEQHLVSVLRDRGPHGFFQRRALGLGALAVLVSECSCELEGVGGDLREQAHATILAVGKRLRRFIEDVAIAPV